MNYDKYPETQIVGYDNDIFADYQAIERELSFLSQESSYCLTVECYPGVYDEILEMIQMIYNPDIVIRSEDIFYDKETLNQMMKAHLTDDRVRGVMYYGCMEDFVDDKKLKEMKKFFLHIKRFSFMVWEQV